MAIGSPSTLVFPRPTTPREIAAKTDEVDAYKSKTVSMKAPRFEGLVAGQLLGRAHPGSKASGQDDRWLLGVLTKVTPAQCLGKRAGLRISDQ